MTDSRINNSEAIKILARAILELSEKSAREWDYDGEQSIATGVDLDLETALKEIING